MKKSAILGIVVVLGAAWTGGAWYTGQKAEDFIKNEIADGNVQLKKGFDKWGIASSMELLSFERGVFSSTAHYRVRLTTPAAQGKPAQERDVLFVEHLNHGPFPLSNLKAGKFAPAMMASDFALEESPAVQEWFTAAKGAVPLSGHYSVSYSKNVSGTFDVAPVTFAQGDTKLTFTGMKGDIDYTTSSKRAVFALNSDGLDLSGPSDTSDIVSMSMKGIAINGDLTQNGDSMYLGSQKVAFKNWTITSKERPPVQLKDTAIAVDLTEAGAAMGAKMVLDFGMINVQDKDMAGLKLAIDLQKVDAKAFKAINAVYEAASTRMLQSKGAQQTPEFTDEEKQIMKTNAELILAGNPTLAVAPLEVRTANGKSTFNLNLDLTKPAAMDGDASQMLMQAVRKLDAKLVLSKGNLGDLMAIEPQVRGVPAEQAAQTAKGQVEMIGTMATAMGVAKVENDSIVSYLNYADGQVDFNGKKMPVEQFLMMVMSGAMGR
ncbi:YdgA family protein [Achromobacter seleniivolatilans]|uniref:YdgA family protein n=1 Tax=Achromobacter seleniivolatilans TaxID=3047478 RepID=A0ABY9LWD1_9BURK|nr:YdgA family protein [Achromobacter sp. R39]WMD19089.1 YdgA family protein [Achromobacter sp. R39]